MNHSDAEIIAFLRGVVDRLSDRPITSFGDPRDEVEELTDAYLYGYDPTNELGLTIPEFAHQAAMHTTRFFAETGVVLPCKLPRNKCEFSDAANKL